MKKSTKLIIAANAAAIVGTGIGMYTERQYKKNGASLKTRIAGLTASAIGGFVAGALFAKAEDELLLESINENIEQTCKNIQIVTHEVDADAVPEAIKQKV